MVRDEDGALALVMCAQATAGWEQSTPCLRRCPVVGFPVVTLLTGLQKEGGGEVVGDYASRVCCIVLL